MMTKSYVPIPARTGVSVAVLLLYGFAGMSMYSSTVIKKGVAGFACVPWWGLVVGKFLCAALLLKRLKEERGP